MSWRISTLANEGIRNMVANPSRFVALFLVLSGTCAALTYVELTSISKVIDLHEAYLERGSDVVVATAPGAIPRRACERLGALTGVEQAGSIAEGPLASLSSSPRTLFRLGLFSQGALGIHGVSRTVPAQSSAGRGFTAGRELADELGLWLGAFVSLADSGATGQVIEVVDSPVLNQTVQRWLVASVVPTGLADECWVRVSPGVEMEYSEQMLDATFIGLRSDLSTRPLVIVDDLARLPSVEFEGRASERFAAMAGVLVGALLVIGVALRRSELGLYRAVGTGRSGLVVLVACEVGAVLIFALFLGLGVGLASGYLVGGLEEVTVGHFFLASRAAATPMALGLSLLIAVMWVLPHRSVAGELKK